MRKQDYCYVVSVVGVKGDRIIEHRVAGCALNEIDGEKYLNRECEHLELKGCELVDSWESPTLCVYMYDDGEKTYEVRFVKSALMGWY